MKEEKDKNIVCDCPMHKAGFYCSQYENGKCLAKIRGRVVI